MASINKVILVGNVGKDPEIRRTESGKAIASFTLATSESWRDKITGEKKESTEWHRVVVFSDGLSGIVEKYVNKGSKLYIEGQLQTRKWTDKDGNDKYTTEVILKGFNANITLLDGRSESNSNDYSSGKQSDYERVSKGLDDDEIPF